MMKLKLDRQTYTDKATVGRLYVDDKFECFTLEDVVRPKKIYGETAIPTGTYKVVVTMSPRFKRKLPLLLDVPGFEGIRIHPGNTAEDTEGCILVGLSEGKDRVNESRKAFQALYDKIVSAGDVEITITD